MSAILDSLTNFLKTAFEGVAMLFKASRLGIEIGSAP